MRIDIFLKFLKANIYKYQFITNLGENQRISFSNINYFAFINKYKVFYKGFKISKLLIIY